MNLFIRALFNRKTFILKLRSEVCMPLLPVQRILNPIERLRQIFYSRSIHSSPEAKELWQCYLFSGLICETWTSIRTNFHFVGLQHTLRTRGKKCDTTTNVQSFTPISVEHSFFLTNLFFPGNLQESVIEWQAHLLATVNGTVITDQLYGFVRLSFFAS